MDMKKNLTDEIIALLEQANDLDQPMWDSAVQCGLPRNRLSNNFYTGINVLILSLAAHKRGYSRNEWLTYKQAQTLGAQVKKGAKSVTGTFYKTIDRKDKNDEDKNIKIAVMTPFWVFNVQDIDGLPPSESVDQKLDFDPIDEAEKILNASKAKITWQGTTACYYPSCDEIIMPDRNRFSSAVNAYAVALHELTHWTGHESRLAREFSGQREAYAFEELVAELGAAFLVGHLGLKGAKLEHHASYLKHYLKILKSDQGAIFRAASLAGQAFEFILNQLTHSTLTHQETST
jgi:antirestriction protein ArdC